MESDNPAVYLKRGDCTYLHVRIAKLGETGAAKPPQSNIITFVREGKLVPRMGECRTVLSRLDRNTRIH